MDIVFLDQNKWIKLAQVHSGRTTSGPMAELFPQLVAAVQRKRVLFPLSVSNIMETAKRNDPDSRRHVAETQAILSLGYAHRSRAGRMAVELRAAIQWRFGVEPVTMPPNWAFASKAGASALRTSPSIFDAGLTQRSLGRRTSTSSTKRWLHLAILSTS